MMGAQIRILLLEDDPEDYNLLARHLQKESGKYSVTWVQTAEVAAERLMAEPFDVVLTDLTVSDSHGLSTVTRLKEFCGSAPVIAMTGLDDISIEHDILATGAQDYLVKGELSGRAVTRSIQHALLRQQSINEVSALVAQLEQSQLLLEKQANLLLRKNRRLRRLYKTAQEFVDNVSHDFRTPLTVIKDYISIIREGMVGEINTQQQEMLDRVSIRADDLNLMVDDLLDVSKLESGLLGAWRRKVQVQDILSRAESMLRQRAAAKNMDFVVECEPDLPLVYCDADKIGRVIINLTVNAIKFCGKEGRVRLWAEADHPGNQVVIGVTDNGPGIDKKSLDKIFKRFERLETNGETAVKGFGLGLNIAKQLTVLNFGELSVQSEVDSGSTFSITVPVAKPLEVFRRWLSFRSTSADCLRVIEITVPEGSTMQSADDFDCFLNCLLRKDDVLFRMEDRNWLLVMALNSSEADLWFDRIKAEYESANRNRPLGPLPEYFTRIRHAWEADASEDCMLRDFAELLPEERYALALS